ncbi:hypothetical protein [Micromonospora sp. NPDC000668]|uniref:hypothetical protein n=1 Tax=Micromonospora sp. NPDC000668 TaxID=3364219 RepID=UPI0036BA8F18
MIRRVVRHEPSQLGFVRGGGVDVEIVQQAFPCSVQLGFDLRNDLGQENTPPSRDRISHSSNRGSAVFTVRVHGLGGAQEVHEAGGGFLGHGSKGKKRG